MNTGNQKGFSLVELLTVMAIFVVVIMLTGQSFNAILASAARLFKSEQSAIEGMAGLETLRYDLNQAGYGLFTEPAGISYPGELTAGVGAGLNDASDTPPRPVLALERTGSSCSGTAGDSPDGSGYVLVPCSDYLSVKATSLGLTAAARSWAYLNVSSGGVVRPRERKNASDTLAAGDSVIAVRKWIYGGKIYSSLVPPAAGGFSYTYGRTAFTGFSSQMTATYTLYGVARQPLRMPFNRADYFVARPPADRQAQQMSAACAPGTGVLYKGLVDHATGGLQYLPLMDCVADMQVVFGWDTDNDGAVDAWSNADGSTAPSAQQADIVAALSKAGNASAANGTSIRSSLRMIKLYILAQNGPKDPGYSNPAPLVVGDTGEMSITHTVNIHQDPWRNYRWKLYTVVASPKNLPVNQ